MTYTTKKFGYKSRVREDDLMRNSEAVKDSIISAAKDELYKYAKENNLEVIEFSEFFLSLYPEEGPVDIWRSWESLESFIYAETLVTYKDKA